MKLADMQDMLLAAVVNDDSTAFVAAAASHVQFLAYDSSPPVREASLLYTIYHVETSIYH